MEDWGTLWWIEKHPESVNLWLWAIYPNVPRPAGRPPKFEEIWDSMENAEVLRLGYDALSKFAHPKGIGLRWLVDFDSESTFFHFGPNVDERDLRTCLYFLILVGQGFLGRIGDLQVRMKGNLDPTWRDAALDVSRRAEAFVAEFHREVLATIDENDLEADDAP